MLAKNVNDNAGCLILRGVLRFFASKLAPTVVERMQKALSQGQGFCLQLSAVLRTPHPGYAGSRHRCR
ncbi:hypothetical protein C7A10_26055 [Pseudomonas fluorescens]|uniref:Uncharacterized protein n=2 Tax=Pseudomonas fluorescens group TaxID=136843 RepID=A0A4Q0HPB0_PSEAZ|nr:hypothetical protein C7A10_26055 [Pseudomonas fluorescens]RXE50608.1 hypothetical protein B4O85_22305 [Pseudomonas azotoformans]